MHNVLANALKETEAVEQTKFYQMAYNDFITEFENHLKIAGKEGNTVTLTDGSQFTYGTYDENCTTDDVCMQISVDTNGKKKPNQAGKDWFTLLLTKTGIKALGEHDTCSEGWDCGAYVLSHHKLWDGVITETQNNNELAQNEDNNNNESQNTSEPDTEPVSTPEPKVSNCSNSDETSCTKCQSGYYVDTTNGQCKEAEGKVTINGKDFYLSDITSSSSYSPSGKVPGTSKDNYWQGANDLCASKGMRLPTDIEFSWLVSTSKGTNGVPEAFTGMYWTSTPHATNAKRAYAASINNTNNASLSTPEMSTNSINVVCVDVYPSN